MKKYFIQLSLSFVFILISSWGFLFAEDEWVRYLYDENVLAVANEGEYLWLGIQNDSGIIRLNKQTGEMNSYYNSNTQFLYKDINCITIDNNGNKWIGTSNAGMIMYNGESWIEYNTTNSMLPDKEVHCITIDKTGNKWIGTANGLARYDGESWIVYNNTNSVLPYNYVTSISIDSNGNKWIGTASGLAEFDGTNWNVYNNTNSGLPDPNNWVNCLAVDKSGNKWIGTKEGGMAMFDGQSWKIYNTENSELPVNSVRCITIDKNGNKWIGTLGMAYYNGINWKLYNKSFKVLMDNSVKSITIDNDGNKWIGTGKGLAGLFDNTISVEEILKQKNRILNCYPNPVNDLTNITFNLLKSENVTIKITDVYGKVKIKIIDNEFFIKGNHNIQFNCKEIRSGIYFCTIKTVDIFETFKIIVVK